MWSICLKTVFLIILLFYIPVFMARKSQFVLLKRKRMYWQTWLKIKQVVVFSFKGYCTLNLKLACFVCHIKIINTFFENNACILNIVKVNVQGYQKWHWKFSRPSIFLKLWIKTVKIVFCSITQELLALLKFGCHFWVPWIIPLL